MGPEYDRERTARVFDEYGDREWSRHEESPSGRVAFHIHRHYLREYVHAGDHVLEVGAGAGRFTIELAEIGARITVADISPGQLELNARHIDEAGLEASVVSRDLADIVDLSRYGDGTFDAAVCYGGPLSFVLDRRDQAFDELLRVTRPGGHLLLGVMSLFGSLHAFLPLADDEIQRFGIEEMQAIVDTGFLPDNHSTLGPTHLFTWSRLRSLIERHRCALVASSAANFLSIGNDELCERWLADDPEMWKRFLGWEVTACAQPGAVDTGTHIIAVVRKPE